MSDKTAELRAKMIRNFNEVEKTREDDLDYWDGEP